MAADRQPPLLRLALPTGVAAMAAALFGVYWDDAWHTDRGRDEFLSPPHLVLYVGIMGLLAVTMGLAAGNVRRGARSRPLRLCMTGAAFVVVSAPVDEWWHQAFGRDAVLWSPPHLAAIAGTIALATGIALLAPGLETSARRPLTIAAGAGVIGAWQVLVLEYDTDVAQFPAVWYLPVMAVAITAACATLHATAPTPVRWPATQAALAYTLAMAGVASGLAWTGFSTPIVPAIIPTAALADVGRRREWSVPMRAAGLTVTLFGTSFIYLGLVPGGVQPSLTEAAVGLIPTMSIVVLVLMATEPGRPRPPAPGLAFAVGALVASSVGLMTPVDPAAAHDPGQGAEVAAITLTIDSGGDTIMIGAEIESDPAIEPLRVVARRGGRSITGPLASSPTGWTGEVDVNETGRWFVYVEARRGGENLEAWIPVIIGTQMEASRTTALYVVADPTDAASSQRLAGAVLLAAVGALLVSTARTIRDHPRPRAPGADLTPA